MKSDNGDWPKALNVCEARLRDFAAASKAGDQRTASGIERFEEQTVVSVRVHLPQDGLDSAFGSDDEGGSLSPKLVAFPACRLVHPHTIGSHDVFLSVTDQRERQ